MYHVLLVHHRPALGAHAELRPPELPPAARDGHGEGDGSCLALPLRLALPLLRLLLPLLVHSRFLKANDERGGMNGCGAKVKGRAAAA